ncbi:MAG: S41 family peptidase [Christensenellaceae bacterium]|nr:S41 family peptidase [Christensenellaceae bacterium]
MLQNKNKRIISFIALIVMVFVFSSGFFSSIFNNEEQITISKEQYEELIRFEELNEIYNIIKKNYYIEPDYEKMMHQAAKGLLSGLEDPYSFYYTPEEFEKYWEEDSGEYAGIGIQILGNPDDLTCRITRVFKGSPSEKAGIKKGDLLWKAGDIDVNMHTLNDAVDFIRGEPGTYVDIKIKRNKEIIDLKVMRDNIHINWIENMMLDDKIGLIQLFEFSGESGKEFKKDFDDLKSKGMEGLIIDLRDNPGGWVNNALGIADLFIDNDVLCYFEFRDGSRQYIRTQDGKIDFPIVVLINENSASASELLSGAFQDYGIAKIVGTVSYGKGIAQDVMTVGKDHAGIQYTSAQYFTPKGRQVHKLGITPDIIVEMPEGEVIDYDLGDLNDPQLKEAYNTILGMIKK